MYKSFDITNFRCFRKLTIRDLKQVNLIAGANNVGKTAFLEALFLHCGAYNPELALRLDAFRGFETFKVELGGWTKPPWISLFHEFNEQKTVELVGEDKFGRRSLRLRWLRDAEELEKLVGRESRSVHVSIDSGKIARTGYSVETTKVLSLEYQQGEKQSTYWLMLDPTGLRVEPIPPPPPFPAYFQGSRTRTPFREDAERYGKLQIEGQSHRFLEILKLIEPRLRSVEVVVVAGEPVLHGDIGAGRLIPLPLMGEGMLRLASLVIYIANAADGVVLIDEIENGLHHSVLPKLWHALGEVARQFNTQIFATTHSLECIVGAHKAFSESESYDFRLYRLERRDDGIVVIDYDRDTLEAAIEAELEVR